MRGDYVEYEIRHIDQWGDAIDVDHFDRKEVALRNASDRGWWIEGAVAIAVERHDWRKSDRGEDGYTTLLTLGEPLAIARWKGEAEIPEEDQC